MRKGKIAFIVTIGIVAVGLCGFVADSAVKERVQKGVTKELKAAEQLAARGELDAFISAGTAANQAAVLIRTHPDIFSETMRATATVSIQKHQARALQLLQIKTLIAEQRRPFAKRLQALTRQQESLPQDDAPLAKVVRKLRAKMIRKELVAVLKSDTPLATRLTRAKTILALHKRPAEKIQHAKLAAMIQQLITTEVTRRQPALQNELVAVASLLDQKKYPEATALMAEQKKARAKLPPALAAALRIAAENNIAANAQSTGAAKSLNPKISAAARQHLRSFFAVAGILQEIRHLHNTAAADMKHVLSRMAALTQSLTNDKNAPPALTAYAQKTAKADRDEVASLFELFQSLRSGRRTPASAMKLAIILTAAASEQVTLRRRDIRESFFGKVSTQLIIRGTPITISEPTNDQRRWAYISVEGRKFSIAWPRQWWYGLYGDCLNAVYLAKKMNAAGLKVNKNRRWEITNTPWFPLARWRKNDENFAFAESAIVPIIERETQGQEAVKIFLQAAKTLEQVIVKDEKIPAELRQALTPVLQGAYGKINQLDELNDDFCRDVILDHYLEQHLPRVTPAIKKALDDFYTTLKPLGLAYPTFSFTLPDGRVFTAMRPLTQAVQEIRGGASGTSKQVAAYVWRQVDRQKNVSHFAAPIRRGRIYRSSTFAGIHDRQPAKVTPRENAILHTADGIIARYTPDMKRLEVDDAVWSEALASASVSSALGRESYGAPMWNFPPHLPIFDARGRIQTMVNRQGVIKSPDFQAIKDLAQRRKAQEAFLAKCATTMTRPGELALFFTYFSQYCFDSPIPQNAKLIGSRLGAGDNHKTSYQFLDYKLGGRFVGDCDDLAEFFQNVTRRQNKQSFMFSLPSHAACGYVQKVIKRKPPSFIDKPLALDEPQELATKDTPKSKSEYTLTFLQTGPPLIFRAETLDDVVEKGVLHFSRESQRTFSAAAVQFLFRFHGEQTRDTYSLSDRILVDPEYAKTLIDVQGMWASHYYSTAIKTMVERLKIDKDISNFTELGGLYRAVSLFNKAAELSRDALHNNDRKGNLRVILEAKTTLATMLHRAGRDREALTVIREMKKEMDALWSKGDRNGYFGFAPFRIEQAGLLGSMELPIKALQLLQRERILVQRMPKVPKQLLYAFAGVYSTMRTMEREGHQPNANWQRERQRVENLLRVAMQKKLFKKDDSFNDLLMNYGLLGGFTISTMDWDKARAKLMTPNAYPDPDKTYTHTDRGSTITEQDWRWFRIIPALYMPFIIEVTNLAEPEKFAPEKALPIIDAMFAGVKAGRKHGSMNQISGSLAHARILKAIIKKDKNAFRQFLGEVNGRNWSQEYDWVATSFGQLSGLIPRQEFPAWMDIFKEYFTGKQYYFKVAYRAINNDHIDRALAAAEASVRYFPHEKAMAQELVYMRKLAVTLRHNIAKRRQMKAQKKIWRKAQATLDKSAREKKWATAAKAGEQAREAARKMAAEGLGKLAQTLGSLAPVYREQKKLAAAVAAYQERVTALETLRGKPQIEVAKALSALASVYLMQKEYAKARPLLERSIGIFKRQRKPNQKARRAALKTYAKVLQEQGKANAAKTIKAKTETLGE